jgi:hypothetical protein
MVRERPGGGRQQEATDRRIRSQLEGDLNERLTAVKRVASAVGEGATAIQLVHEYLRDH